MSVHSIYTLRQRRPEDGRGGPLTTVYLATVLGAASGREAADLYFQSEGVTPTKSGSRTSHVGTRNGRFVSVSSRKETSVTLTP